MSWLIKRKLREMAHEERTNGSLSDAQLLDYLVEAIEWEVAPEGPCPLCGCKNPGCYMGGVR